MGGLFGAIVGWVLKHSHEIAADITLYGGAIVVILSGISWLWDIYNKCRHRKD